MNEAIKTKWIAALRSGDYKQCKNVLRNGDAYCCLGVLGKITGILTPLQLGGNTGYSELQRTGLMEGDRVVVADMNDSGSSFKEIADWIEDNL